MSIKLVGVIHSLTIGGAEKNFAFLFNQLSQRGFDCSIILLNPKSTKNFKLDPCIKTFELEPLSFLGFIGFLSKLRKTICDLNPDCLISFMDQTNILSLLALLNKPEIPVIVCERNNPAKNFIISRKFPAPIQKSTRLFRNLVYKKARLICTQTQGATSYFERYCPRIKTVAIPNYVEIPENTDDAIRENKVISVSRLVPEKGLVELTELFAKLSPKFPEWSLEIYGEGPQKGLIQKLILDLEMQEKIRLYDKTEQISAVYQKASVFVLNSDFEGFPNALLEAMAHGCAVIANDCPYGPSEIIEDRHSGWLSNKEINSSLHNSLETLMSSPDLRKSLGNHARIRGQKFSEEKFVNSFHKLIVDLSKTGQITH